MRCWAWRPWASSASSRHRLPGLRAWGARPPTAVHEVPLVPRRREPPAVRWSCASRVERGRAERSGVRQRPGPARGEREGYRSVLSVPLVSKGRVLGALRAYCGCRIRRHRAIVSVMTRWSGQAAVALATPAVFGWSAIARRTVLVARDQQERSARSPPREPAHLHRGGIGELLDLDNAGSGSSRATTYVVAGLPAPASHYHGPAAIRWREPDRRSSRGSDLMCELATSGMRPSSWPRTSLSTALPRCALMSASGHRRAHLPRGGGPYSPRAGAAGPSRARPPSRSTIRDSIAEASEQRSGCAWWRARARVVPPSTRPGSSDRRHPATRVARTARHRDLAAGSGRAARCASRRAGEVSGPLRGSAPSSQRRRGRVGRRSPARAGLTTDVRGDPRIELRRSRALDRGDRWPAILAVPIVREPLGARWWSICPAGARCSAPGESSTVRLRDQDRGRARERPPVPWTLAFGRRGLRSWTASLPSCRPRSTWTGARAIAEVRRPSSSRVPLASIGWANEATRTLTFRTASIRGPTDVPPRPCRYG